MPLTFFILLCLLRQFKLHGFIINLFIALHYAKQAKGKLNEWDFLIAAGSSAPTFTVAQKNICFDLFFFSPLSFSVLTHLLVSMCNYTLINILIRINVQWAAVSCCTNAGPGLPLGSVDMFSLTTCHLIIVKRTVEQQTHVLDWILGMTLTLLRQIIPTFTLEGKNILGKSMTNREARCL